jgi:hypothetical protein
MERSVAQLNDTLFTWNQFLQLSRLHMSWDTRAEPGRRIIDAILDDGTHLIDDGAIVSGRLLDVATNSFLAAGGDHYSMLVGPNLDSGFTDQEALGSYIVTAPAGTVSASDYPAGMNDRRRLLRSSSFAEQ